MQHAAHMRYHKIVLSVSLGLIGVMAASAPAAADEACEPTYTSGAKDARRAPATDQPTTEMYSPGMVAGGVTMLIIGTSAIGVGSAFIGMDRPNDWSGMGTFVGLLVMVPGVVVAGSGVPLLVVGARQEPVEEEGPIQGATLELRGDGLVASLRF